MEGSILLSAQCPESAFSKRLNPIWCCQSSQIVLLYQILVRESLNPQKNISFIGVNCKTFNINLDEKGTMQTKQNTTLASSSGLRRVEKKEINKKKEEDNNDIED